MTVIKKYVKPCITIVSISRTNMLCSSSHGDIMKHICSKGCRFWHICRDREEGKYCFDKEYK